MSEAAVAETALALQFVNVKSMKRKPKQDSMHGPSTKNIFSDEWKETVRKIIQKEPTTELSKMMNGAFEIAIGYKILQCPSKV